MSQVSRNVTDAGDGFLMGKRFLIHDRDPLFTAAFRETLAAAGVQVVRLPPRSPNLNAYAERFARTIKESCLDRMILIGEGSLRRAVGEFIEHYHRERIIRAWAIGRLCRSWPRPSATAAFCLVSGSVAC